jgi:HK97 gp10 family phage protein
MSKLVNIKGGEELQQFLNQLPVKVEKNIMRSALRAGAKVIEKEALSNLFDAGAIDSGDLARSLRVSTAARRGKVTASVKAGDQRAWYWRFVEFGTAAHTIKGKNGKRLFFNGTIVSSVNHPGARAKPFMRPALDSKSSEAIRAVGRKIGERLTKHGINNAPALEVDDK